MDAWYDPPVVDEWSAVFGGWRHLVARLYDKLDELLDEVDAKGGIVLDVVDSFADTFLWWLPGSQIFQLASEMIEDTTTLLRSEMTDDYADELACAGFCLMYSVDNMAFTQDVLDAWREEAVFDGFNLKMVLSMLVADIGYKWLLDRYVLGLNNPDEDYLVLCAACVLDYDIPEEATWSYVFDFTQQAHGFETRGTSAVVRSANGWHIQNLSGDGNYSTSIGKGILVQSPGAMIYAQVKMLTTSGHRYQNSEVMITYSGSGSDGSGICGLHSEAPGTYLTDWNGSTGASYGMWCLIGMSGNVQTGTDMGYIQRLVIAGTGNDWFAGG